MIVWPQFLEVNTLGKYKQTSFSIALEDGLTTYSFKQQV